MEGSGTEQPKIRLLVADDHPMLREGLVAVLGTQPDFEVVGEAADGSEVVRLVERLRPDVILLDLEMPGMDGVAALEQLRETGTEAHAVVFTAYDTDERILGAIRAGARGYLLKGASRVRDLLRHPHRPLRRLAPATRGDRQVTRPYEPRGSPNGAGFPDPQGDRSARTARPGIAEQGDSRAAFHQRTYGEIPRQLAARQTRRRKPYGGGQDRRPSRTRRAALVHHQNRLWVMSYSSAHETSDLRTYALKGGAQGS